MTQSAFFPKLIPWAGLAPRVLMSVNERNAPEPPGSLAEGSGKEEQFPIGAWNCVTNGEFKHAEADFPQERESVYFSQVGEIDGPPDWTARVFADGVELRTRARCDADATASGIQHREPEVEVRAGARGSSSAAPGELICLQDFKEASSCHETAGDNAP